MVACASTGNAASSLAGAAASVGLRAVIFVPEFAPEPKVAQLLVFGARVIRVKGSYDQTWELCQRACARYGWYNRNAAVNPSLVEGKKTCGLEIGEQLGAERARTGWRSRWGTAARSPASEGPAPRCARSGLVRRAAAHAGRAGGGRAAAGGRVPGRAATWCPGARADAGGQHLRRPSRATGARRCAAVRESGGAFVAVPDEAILEAMRESGPPRRRVRRAGRRGGAGGLAAAPWSDGIVGPPRSRALAVVTGSGLKDVRTAIRAAGAPVTLPADDAQLDAYLKDRPV